MTGSRESEEGAGVSIHGLEPDVALKHAVTTMKGVLASVVDDEKRVIEDGGYRQVRLAS